MLAIKLQRVGKKHQPSYRLVVSEKKSKMAAPPVEDLGSYNPFTKAAAFNKERVEYWMKVGAQPTVTTHNLLVANGILAAPRVVVKMRKKVKAAEPVAARAAAADSATAPESAPAAAESAPAPAPATENAPAAEKGAAAGAPAAESKAETPAA